MTHVRAWSLCTMICLCQPLSAQDADRDEAVRARAADARASGAQLDLIGQLGTDFRGLDLRNVDFRGAHTIGSESNLRSADFTGADLRGARFGASKLQGSIFIGANLAGARFVTADLSGADFSGAILGDVIFQECNFARADLGGADLSAATANGCSFRGADLSNAILSGIRSNLRFRDFRDANLSHADLSGVDLSGAPLDGADLTAADLRGADLTEADLTGCDLTGARIEGIDVKHAILVDVDGLDPVVLADLRRRADRAAFERARARQGLLRALKTPLHGAVAIGAIAITTVAWRRARRRAWAVPLLACNCAALLPPAVLLAVRMAGGHTTAQLSGGSGGFQLWSLWVMVWPVSIFGALGGLVLCTGVGGVSVFHAFRQDRSALWLLCAGVLTALHSLLLLRLLFEHFPDA